MNSEIDAILEQEATPPGFRERARQTARQGAALVRMQHESGRFLAFPAPFVDWVRQVAAGASVDLGLIRDWLGRDLTPIDEGVGTVYAILGDALGLSRRFVRDLALLGLAQEMKLGLEPAGEFGRGGKAEVLEALEAELEAMAMRLQPEQLRRWARLEEEIRGHVPREAA